ncbi:transposase [Actinomadura sp. BRA 177]|nr:transposase [Actinomadura sp. BRA 177]
MGLLEELLPELHRKNCWTIAEHAGDRDPYGTQHLLNRAVWDADAVHDDPRGYVTEQLSSAAVPMADETGDLMKGTCTAGRIENSQVAVFLSYATGVEHAFFDRELYLPAGLGRRHHAAPSGRDAASVHRYRRPDREQLGRGVLQLCDGCRACLHRPGGVSLWDSSSGLGHLNAGFS